MTDLILEQTAQRLDEVKGEILGQTPHVVVALDSGGVARSGFDHVGVQRALDEEARTVTALAEFARDGLELTDEEFADDLSFGLGIDDARERIEESVLGLHVDQFDTELARKCLFDLFALVLSHETGVHEDARQLVTHRLGDQGRRHRGVDAARQRAEDLLGPDLRANRGDLFFDDRGIGPGGRDLGDVVKERREQLLSPLGMGDLGVELYGVEATVGVLHRRDRGFGRRGAYDETFGGTRNGVTVAHPAVGRGGPFTHQARRTTSGDHGASVFSRPRARDVAAELQCHELGAVTDAQDRNAEFVDRRIQRGCGHLVDRLGSSRQDDCGRGLGPYLVGANRALNYL